MEYGAVETSRNFLLQSTAFARLKLKYFDSHTFDVPGDMGDTDISRLKKFVLVLKRIVCLPASLRLILKKF